MSKGAIKTALLACVVPAFWVALAAEEPPPGLTFYTVYRYHAYEEFLSNYHSGESLYNREHREGRVVLRKRADGTYMVQVGGKIEGTGMADMPNTKLLALLPVASMKKTDTFLTIGLGAGVTVQTARGIVNDVDLVEINDGVVKAIRDYGPPGVLNGVNVYVNDARNFLMLTGRTYDVISSEPSYPTDSGTASLFTRDFYEIARSKMSHDGVFCQWLPYYILNSDDVTMMLRTFSSVFKYVRIWKVPAGNDLLMTGSQEPFPYTPAEVLERVGRLDGSGIVNDVVLSKDEGQALELYQTRTEIPLNTDDKPLLEFNAAIAYMGYHKAVQGGE